MQLSWKTLRSFTGERWWKSAKNRLRLKWISKLENYVNFDDAEVQQKKHKKTTPVKEFEYEVWDIVRYRMFDVECKDRIYHKYLLSPWFDFIILLITQRNKPKVRWWNNRYLAVDKYWNKFKFICYPPRKWFMPDELQNRKLWHVNPATEKELLKEIIDSYEALNPLSSHHKYAELATEADLQ